MKKTEKIEVCCTLDQKGRIFEKALAFGISASEYLLFVGLNVEILCKVGADTFIAGIDILECQMKQGIITPEQFKDMVDILIKKQKNIHG